MKLAVKNTNFVIDENNLKSINSTTISDSELKLVGNVGYQYFKGSKEGVNPNDLTVSNSGRWVKKPIEKTIVSVVDDNYDFNLNNSTDISSIINWNILGVKLIDSGIRDEMTLRNELRKLIVLKAGSQYENFETTLNVEEEQIALKYVPTKIIDSRGFAFFATRCGGMDKAEEKLNFYTDLAVRIRSQRYRKFVFYAYSQLGINDGLNAEKRVRQNQLKSQYIERGVVRKMENQVDGVTDWLKGEIGTAFENDSLLGSLNSDAYTLNDPGLSKTDFIDNCIAELED